ncbi:hypothetical protein OC25_17540 [Pedobacter kyungheensis]|uniref:Conjugal transfer protein TraF n=1 Tax=Pedobacter kyungheensis TaxID=1069985 RepID=A0A0C1D5E7_9SPHI|nr:DUF4133 domain-containing protein [Pedobacter kyungheensis]KIA92241.1 hypothetical protein OC25_17540 [Pedobacter kyungheensis]
MSLVYHINKGVGRPIIFKGFQGQYIAWLSGGLVLLMLCFTVLYVAGVSLFVLLPLVFVLGGGLFFCVNYLSKRFGQNGLGKFLARRGLPVYLRFSSRRVFTGLRVAASNRERQVMR